MAIDSLQGRRTAARTLETVSQWSYVLNYAEDIL